MMGLRKDLGPWWISVEIFQEPHIERRKMLWEGIYAHHDGGRGREITLEHCRIM
jgi:hypothetical protein